MNEQETIADIVAEMRRGTKLPGYWHSCDVNKILQYHADRLEAAHKRERGDSAKLREALKLCMDEMCNRCRDLSAERGNPLPCLNGCEPVRKAKAALSAPPRNCDVGTAEEQESRWKTNCGHGIPNCKHCKVYEEAKNSGLVNGRYLMRCDCRFIWAQMPYVAKEGGVR